MWFYTVQFLAQGQLRMDHRPLALSAAKGSLSSSLLWLLRDWAFATAADRDWAVPPVHLECLEFFVRGCCRPLAVADFGGGDIGETVVDPVPSQQGHSCLQFRWPLYKALS